MIPSTSDRVSKNPSFVLKTISPLGAILLSNHWRDKGEKGQYTHDIKRIHLQPLSKIEDVFGRDEFVQSRHEEGTRGVDEWLEINHGGHAIGICDWSLVFGVVRLIERGEQTRGKLAMIGQHMQSIELCFGETGIQTIDLGDQGRVGHRDCARADANEARACLSVKLDVSLVRIGKERIKETP